MKIRTSIIVLAACLLSGRALAWWGCNDWVIADFAVHPPVEVPIPWSDYEERSTPWGQQDVYGLGIGLLYGIHHNVYGLDVGMYERCASTLYGAQVAVVGRAQDLSGLQGGIVTWCDGKVCGLQLGIYNYAEACRGVQIGVANYTREAVGVQIGLLNFMSNGYFKFFPIVNMRF